MRKQNKYEQAEAKSYRFWWVIPLGFIFVARGILERFEKGKTQ